MDQMEKLFDVRPNRWMKDAIAACIKNERAKAASARGRDWQTWSASMRMLKALHAARENLVSVGQVHGATIFALRS